MTLETEITAWSDWLRHKSKPTRESTIDAYRAKTKRLVRFLEEKAIDSFSPEALTPETLKEFKDLMVDRERDGAKDVREILAIVRILMKWAEDPDQASYKWYRTARTDMLRHSGSTLSRRRERLKRLPMLSPQDVLDIMAIAEEVSAKRKSSRNSALLALMYSSGARLDEALNVRVRDVTRDDTEKCWRVVFPKSKATAKTRTGYLTGFAGDNVLVKWLKAREASASDGEEPLFLSESNRRMTSSDFYHIWARIQKAAAVRGGDLAGKMEQANEDNCSGHLLRHCRARFLGQYKGWQFAALKAWLGDEGDEMVSYYVQKGGVEIQLARDRGEPHEMLKEPEAKCVECGSFLLPGGNFCPVCAVPLTVDAERILKERFSDVDEFKVVNEELAAKLGAQAEEIQSVREVAEYAQHKADKTHSILVEWVDDPEIGAVLRKKYFAESAWGRGTKVTKAAEATERDSGQEKGEKGEKGDRAKRKRSGSGKQPPLPKTEKSGQEN